MYSAGSIPGSYAGYSPPASLPLLPSAAALRPPVSIPGPVMMPTQSGPMLSMPMQTMPPTQSGPMMSMPMQTMPMQTMSMPMPPQLTQSFPPMPVSMTAMGSMGPPPPPPPDCAWVPKESGLWMPRVSYKVKEVREEQREENGEKPFPVDREHLLRYVAHQDEQIQELKIKAKSLRSKQHGDHNDWHKRVEDLEAHVLSAKLKPVTDGADAAPEAPPLPTDLTPNGLLQEFADRATAPEQFMDMTEDEEDALIEQQELAMKSEMLGLPSLAALGLEAWNPDSQPNGAKIIDIRFVEPGGIGSKIRAAYFRRQQMEERAKREKGLAPQPPTLRGRVMDSNYYLTPSPLHPVGQYARMGVLDNLYPIDRAPIRYDNIFESTWPGAEEKWYQAYADYYQARNFPDNLSPEYQWEMDVDRGQPVCNQQWCSEPKGDPMAAVGVDVTGDGFSDITVVGKDKNRDGVPDILQVPPVVRLAQNVCGKIFPY